MRPSSIASASLIPPLRLAIIGSGPSGFYSAARILHSLKQSSLDAPDVRVDMFERLPIPNGLVRWGVAPDHLEVKNVEHKFAEVASDPRFRFFGNVNVVEEAATKKLDVAAGSSTKSKRASAYTYPHAIEIPLSTLAQHYTHILFSYGCSHSRPLGIPGSSAGELTNVHSALDFVNWYNGHPAAHDFDFLQSEPWRKVDLIGARQMSIIGAGNVALDVARIVLRASTGSLLEATSSSKAREELAKSDIPEPILQHLSESKITQVDINARRGPAQAAFTNKELREMLALQANVSVG
jgi:adrenodoxin-NADP+ reductase